MGKKDNETNKQTSSNPLEADFSNEPNADAEVKSDGRTSLRDDAPSAVNLGRESVSGGPLPNLDAEKKAPVAGGMKTVSDRQAFLGRKMASIAAKYKGDALKDLYQYARESVRSDLTNQEKDPTLSAAKLDQSKALFLACHQALVNSPDRNMQAYVATYEKVNAENLKISTEDCQKFSADMANPDTDWSALEKQNEERKKENVLTDRQKEMVKAELAGLQKKGMYDLTHGYSDAKKEAQANLAFRHSENATEAEKFDRSFAKMLAGEYVLRQSNEMIATRTLHVNRGVTEASFGVSPDELDGFMNELSEFEKSRQDPSLTDKKQNIETEENLEETPVETEKGAKETPVETEKGAKETPSDKEKTETAAEETIRTATEEKAEEKPGEKTVAGGMKTITDRQALLAREKLKTMGKPDAFTMADQYSLVRDQLTAATKNLSDSPESIQKHDEAVANLLAFHSSLVNSKDPSMKTFAEDCTGANQMSFGISMEDCAKVSSDLANPNADWTPVEDKIHKEDQPKRLAQYAKAELEGLKDKSPNELVDYFNKARRDTKLSNEKNGKENTKASEADFERSFGKMLAGEYLLRNTPGLQAKSSLSAANNLYENTFHMSQKDRDAMMERIKNEPTPVNTPTVEGVKHPVNEKNEYPEAPEQKGDDTAVNTPTVEGVKHPVNEKNEYPEEPVAPQKEAFTPEQLKDKMEHAGALLGATVGKETSKDAAESFAQSVADLEKLSPELRGPLFAELFRNHAKSEMQTAISSTLQGRKNGKMGATFSETSAAAQNYLKAQFDYYTASHPDWKGMTYPPLGGLQPSEIRDMQTSALLSLPPEAQQPNEKKNIGIEYNANKSAQAQAVSAEFRSHIAGVNREQNVQFSAAGIEKYLGARWKEGAGKDLDTQREHFQKEYREFKEKAYEKMLSKIDRKTDLKKQLASFDKFCSQLDTVCKAKGWVDKDAPYAFGGGLSVDTLKNLQAKAVDKLPKNTAEQSKDTLEDLMGDKERRRQAENEKKQKEEIENIKGSTKKDKEKRKALQDKAALDKKKSQKRIEQKEKNFQAEIKKCLDAVPANPESFDNPGVRNALGMVRAMENKLGEHGKAWRAFHPFQTRKMNNAINDIMKGLEAKGYKKESIDHLLHNPQKPENDPVSQDVKKQKDSIKEMQNDREKLENEQREFQANKDKLNVGERITVPEADNVKDIVNPKERSKFIVVQKTNELSLGGQQQTQNTPQQTRQPQQMQAPTTM